MLERKTFGVFRIGPFERERLLQLKPKCVIVNQLIHDPTRPNQYMGCTTLNQHSFLKHLVWTISQVMLLYLCPCVSSAGVHKSTMQKDPEDCQTDATTILTNGPMLGFTTP